MLAAIGNIILCGFEASVRHMNRLIFFCLLLFTTSALASANSGITYHGRILKPDGTPVTDSAVQFKMQVLTPDSNSCVMFQEIQTKDLSSTGGAFSITINDGTGVQTFYGYTIDQIFGNYGTFSLTPATCSSGTGTYTPNTGDGRTFLVSFKTPSMTSYEPLPNQSINFAPLAIEAKQVAGFPGNTLLRVDNGTGPTAIRALTAAEGNELLNLADGSSTKYVQSTGNGAPLPAFATNPSAPVAGDFWYDSTNKALKFYDGSSVQTLADGMGVTSITAGTGLSGGTITSTGTISMPNVGTAGTYTKVTTDAQGRVSSGAQITGDDITSGTIGGSTAMNTTGNITTSGNVIATNVSSTTDSTINLKIYESTDTNAVTITAPAGLVSGGYGLVLPANKATVAGQMLTSDTSGNLSWTTATGGTVTGLTGDVTGSGSGSITTTVNKVNGVAYGSSPSTNTVPVVTAANTVTYEAVPNAALANSSITLGTTSVSLGATASSLAGLNSVGVGVAGTSAGTFTIANTNASGTITIQNPSAAAAYNFNLPATAGTSGQVLLSAGGGSSAMTWGTLTVGSGGTGLSGGTQGGIPYFATSSTMASSAALAQHAVVVGGGSSGGAPYTLSSLGNSGSVLISGGASADPAFGAIDLTSSNAVSGVLPVANGGTGNSTLTVHNLLVGNGSSAINSISGGAGTLLTGQGASSDPAFSATPTIGVNGAGGTTGKISFANGVASGASTTLQPSASTTSAWTLTLPSNAGTSGYVLQTDGTGTTSWVGVTNGTVTNIATGTGLTGGPISTTGTISLASISSGGILANATAGSAAPTDTTLSALIDRAISSTQGAILYRNGSAWVALSPGTSGQFLQTLGTSANPQWATPSAVLPTLADDKIWVGQSGTATAVTMSGDAAMTNAGVVTVAKVNGVSYPAAPATNTVPVVTASNTITYEALPNAALANSSITLGSTSVALGATASSIAGLTSLTATTVTGTSTVAAGVDGSTAGSVVVYNTNASAGVSIKNPSTAASGAYNFNLPATAGTSGQVLLSGGGGTNPMTWGTLTVGSGGTGLSGGVQGGIPYFASSSTMASSAALTQYGVVIGGGTGAPTSTAAGAAGTVLTGQGSANPSFSATPTLGVNGTTTGSLALANGAASGAATTISPSASTTSAWTLTLPSSAGTSGYYLQTNGSGVTSWVDPSAGSTGYFKNGGNSFGTAATLGTNDTYTLGFKTNNATRMTIDTSGNVGIGTTSPNDLLQITSSSSNANIRMQSAAGSQTIFNFLDGSTAKWQMGKNTDNSFYLWDSTGTLQVLKASPNGSLALTPAGSVGIGTASPSATYALDVTGSVRATSGMYASGFYYTSDQRLKENIQTIENPIEKIMALRGVNFQWKESKEKDLGFIAQEVEKVLPEVMGSRPDQKYGEIKTVKYANIVALAVESIKEVWNKLMNHEERIDQLEKENQELKARLDQLEQKLNQRAPASQQ